MAYLPPFAREAEELEFVECDAHIAPLLRLFIPGRGGSYPPALNYNDIYRIFYSFIFGLVTRNFGSAEKFFKIFPHYLLT